MQITGIGVDIESVSRFRKKQIRKNTSFYNKIFTSKEIAYCLSKQDPYPHFTARFCAKEAFIKAIDQKIVDYRSIKIHHDNNKPVINWRGSQVFLSLAHNTDKAIAFVTIAKK